MTVTAFVVAIKQESEQISRKSEVAYCLGGRASEEVEFVPAATRSCKVLLGQRCRSKEGMQ